MVNIMLSNNNLRKSKYCQRLWNIQLPNGSYV